MSIGHRIRIALRKGLALTSTVLPRERSLRVERYLRGWEDDRALRESDVVIVSYGKSGRTWLRVLLSRYYQLRYDLPANRLLQVDNMHALNQAVRRISFTHCHYLGAYS